MATRPTKSELGQQRMTKAMLALAQRRGRLPALVTAAGIAAVLLTQSFLSTLIAWANSTLYGRVSFGAAAFEPSPWLPDYIVGPFLSVSIPLAVGVFVSLWLLAPVSEELTLRFVLTRGALAAVVGSLLVLIVAVFVSLVYAFGTAGSQGGIVFGVQFFNIRDFAHGVVGAGGTAAGTFVSTIPLVLFATVLEWLWLRAHPRDYAVVGLVDDL